MRFDVAAANSFPGQGYDLIACFNCLHDMGDPVAAARHVGRTLASDGTWMIVKPNAADRIEDTSTRSAARGRLLHRPGGPRIDSA
jgi:hypothetical protein